MGGGYPQHPLSPQPLGLGPACGGQWRSGWGQQGVHCALREGGVGTLSDPEDRDVQPQATASLCDPPTGPWTSPGVGGAAGWGPDKSPTRCTWET